ncbi:MAG: hypothetical protein PVG66_14070 [Chromatiales bacterium]|jgi:hypothetical protein
MTDPNKNPANTAAAPQQQSRSALIEILTQLYLKIAHQLRHMHLSRSKMGKARKSVNIWERLQQHLEQMPVMQEDSPAPSIEAHPHPGNNHTHSDLPLTANELGDYYSHGISNHLHPHMADQMQQKTFEHINISLHLAKTGDKSGAKLHIELAENAMSTASQFMERDQYREFRQRIEQRLESIVQNGHPTTSS